MLGTKNKWFHCLIMEDSIWKFACLRDLQLPEPQHTFLNWIKLYASAFGNKQGVKFSPYFSYVVVLIVDQYHHLLNDCLADGSHSFMFRQREKHIGNCPSLLLLSGFFCLRCKRHQLVPMVEAAASVVSGDCSYEKFSVIK